jgi:hypothetical protein
VRLDDDEHGSMMNRAMVGGRTFDVSTYPVVDQVGSALNPRSLTPSRFFRVFHCIAGVIAPLVTTCVH